MQESGVEVIFDDRDARPGQKFADAELMGIPYRVTISDRLIDGGEFEVVSRKDGSLEMMTLEAIFEKFTK